MKEQTSLILQKELEEVSALGYWLSEEDIRLLVTTQKLACKANHMIDFDHHIIYELSRQFVYSPYIQISTFINVLKDALYAYYTIRRYLKNWYDHDIVVLLYDQYLQHHGMLDKRCIFACIQSGRHV